MTEEHCNTCKDLRSIQRIFDADQSDIAENNLYTNTPVVVIDATEQWDAVNKFNIDFLAKVICQAMRPFCFFNYFIPLSTIHSYHNDCPFVAFTENL